MTDALPPLRPMHVDSRNVFHVCPACRKVVKTTSEPGISNDTRTMPALCAGCQRLQAESAVAIERTLKG